MNQGRPPGERLGPFPTVAIYAALVLGVGHTILFNLLPDSPLRGGGEEKIVSGNNESFLSHLAGEIGAKSDGRSIGLHAAIPPEYLAGDADKEVAGIYYYTAYAFYPRRLYVGEDDRVVNNGKGLLGPPASPQWLADRGVQKTLEITANPQRQLSFSMAGSEAPNPDKSPPDKVHPN